MTTTFEPPPARVPPAEQPHAHASRVALLIGGILLGLLGLITASLAAASGWATYQQRDGRYLTGPTERYSVSSYALTTTELSVLTGQQQPTASAPVASVLVRATAADPGQAVFIGVASADQAAGYLRDVDHAQLTQVSFAPFRPVYREIQGTRTPAPPGEQTFWAASSEGTGAQSLELTLQPGTWVVVIMNADASPSVAVDLTAGVRTALLGPITAGLTVGALLLLGGAVALLIIGAAGLGRAAAPVTGSVVTASRAYPAELSGELEPVSRGLWLVKWILVIPHLIILAVLWPIMIVTTVVAAFAILFTGRYPRSLFDFSVGVLRWTWRVSFYSYSALGTDRYPPFSLARTDYPADFEVAYPARLSRGLVLVKSWLLAIPQLIIVGLFTSPWYWAVNGSATDNYQNNGGISLLGLLVIVAAIVVLFTGRYPRSLFDLVMGINRWVYRVLTYVLLLRDEYPPFRLDQGPHEPRVGTSPDEEGSPDEASEKAGTAT